MTNHIDISLMILNHTLFDIIVSDLISIVHIKNGLKMQIDFEMHNVSYSGRASFCIKCSIFRREQEQSKTNLSLKN